MRGRGVLVVVSGPSGAGKGSICDRLKEINRNVVFSVSATTRAKRCGEVEGKDYHFVSRDEFETMIKSGSLIEHSFHFGNYYGTPKAMVEKELKKGKNVILEIDVKGGSQIRDTYPETIYVFVLPPSILELKKRLMGRGTENEDEMRTRLKRIIEELDYLDKYDYSIVNASLDEAANELNSIIKSVDLRAKNRVDFVNQMRDDLENSLQSLLDSGEVV